LEPYFFPAAGLRASLGLFGHAISPTQRRGEIYPDPAVILLKKYNGAAKPNVSAIFSDFQIKP
jgi:hypothetical protein